MGWYYVGWFVLWSGWYCVGVVLIVLLLLVGTNSITTILPRWGDGRNLLKYENL